MKPFVGTGILILFSFAAPTQMLYFLMMGGWLWRCVRLGPSARAVQGTEQAAAPMTQRQGIKPFFLEMLGEKKCRFQGLEGAPRLQRAGHLARRLLWGRPGTTGHQ